MIERRFLSYLWRGLPVAAIVFQAGISGAWWAGQFSAPLPGLWGWFGALIIGLAMWSGVELVVAGERRGWLLVAATAVGDSVMALAYFQADHPAYVALPLAVVPAVVTVLTGWQAGQQAAIEARPAAQAEAEQTAWEREQAALDREAERQAVLVRARAEARALSASVRDTAGQPPAPVRDTSGTRPAEVRQPSGVVLAMSGDDQRILDTLLGTSLSVREASGLLGVAPSTLHERARRLGLHKNGNGWALSG